MTSVERRSRPPRREPLLIFLSGSDASVIPNPFLVQPLALHVGVYDPNTFDHDLGSAPVAFQNYAIELNGVTPGMGELAGVYLQLLVLLEHCRRNVGFAPGSVGTPVICHLYSDCSQMIEA